MVPYRRIQTIVFLELCSALCLSQLLWLLVVSVAVVPQGPLLMQNFSHWVLDSSNLGKYFHLHKHCFNISETVINSLKTQKSSRHRKSYIVFWKRLMYFIISLVMVQVKRVDWWKRCLIHPGFLLLFFSPPVLIEELPWFFF